jgi:hypothetical protein
MESLSLKMFNEWYDTHKNWKYIVTYICGIMYKLNWKKTLIKSVSRLVKLGKAIRKINLFHFYLDCYFKFTIGKNIQYKNLDVNPLMFPFPFCASHCARVPNKASLALWDTSLSQSTSGLPWVAICSNFPFQVSCF